jgi:hypothetical protein
MTAAKADKTSFAKANGGHPKTKNGKSRPATGQLLPQGE